MKLVSVGSLELCKLMIVVPVVFLWASLFFVKILEMVNLFVKGSHLSFLNLVFSHLGLLSFRVIGKNLVYDYLHCSKRFGLFSLQLGTVRHILFLCHLQFMDTICFAFFGSLVFFKRVNLLVESLF